MEDTYLQKLQPFLDKNNGNPSAAIRDAIELADAALRACLKIQPDFTIGIGLHI